MQSIVMNDSFHTRLNRMHVRCHDIRDPFMAHSTLTGWCGVKDNGRSSLIETMSDTMKSSDGEEQFRNASQKRDIENPPH